jgi:hypothetical protein
LRITLALSVSYSAIRASSIVLLLAVRKKRPSLHS